MTPDINAGLWYLRGRGDCEGHAWDVCEPITGEAVADITVDPQTHELTARGDDEACAAGSDAVRRFLAQLIPEPGQ